MQGRTSWPERILWPRTSAPQLEVRARAGRRRVQAVGSGAAASINSGPVCDQPVQRAKGESDIVPRIDNPHRVFRSSWYFVWPPEGFRWHRAEESGALRDFKRQPTSTHPVAWGAAGLTPG